MIYDPNKNYFKIYAIGGPLGGRYIEASRNPSRSSAGYTNLRIVTADEDYHLPIIYNYQLIAFDIRGKTLLLYASESHGCPRELAKNYADHISGVYGAELIPKGTCSRYALDQLHFHFHEVKEPTEE